jgi:hypothetical protein
MTETLTPKDIQDLLTMLSVAIELDQVLVDELPAERFSLEYNDAMWREWRRNHRYFIDQLVVTADMMEPGTLSELTRLSITHEPGPIGTTVLEILAEIVSGSCGEELSTAQSFFGHLITQIRGNEKSGVRREDPRISILRWFPMRDPLRIGQDPECAYL